MATTTSATPCTGTPGTRHRADSRLLRFKVAARQGGGTGQRRNAGFRPSIPDLVHRSREVPRDFRGICVKLDLTLGIRKPHN